MKLKYFLASLVAVFTVVFTSCSDEYESTYLDQIQVSSSYVSLPLGGGQTTIQLTTGSNYEVVGAPEWLTITPATGAAGTTNVTFSADATVDGRSTDQVTVKCGNVKQYISVIQGLATVSSATCAEIISGIENKTYRVTGVCTAIANTQYGNFYLNDGTGEVYIYGTVDAAGAYNWASFGIEIGDEVTVEGPMKNYNGTIELVDATFISVSKSLIKVDAVSTDNLSSDGGDFTVTLVNKGDGLYVDVPAEAQSWLSIKSVQGNEVVFHASANTAGPRNATLVFKTVKGGKEYTAQTGISQDGLSGTADVPFTVEEAIAFCSKISAQTTQSYYVKGIVSKVVGEFGAQYGNGSFWLSSDGNFNDDLAKDFEAYQVNWFDGQKWVEGNGQVSVGDEVVVCGPLTTYKGTAETAGKGAAHIVSINGITKAGYGLGSIAAPFTPEGACMAAFSGSTASVYVAGKVAKFPKDSDKFNAQYGNASFWMSLDGSYAGDKAVEFEAYRVLYLGNRKWAEGDIELKEGDDVVIYGPLTTYNGTAETQGNKGYLISINGKTE